MIELIKERDGLQVQITAIPMGDDLCVTIGGGEKPHIGAVALGVPTPSLASPGKLSASISVLTLTGHKEDELARKAADALAGQLGRVVVVCCGIHKDAITPQEIEVFRALVDEVIGDLTKCLKENWSSTFP